MMAMQLNTASKVKLLKVRMFLWHYDVASLEGSTQGWNAMPTRGCVDTCRAVLKRRAMFGG